jgi:hypothetical protein
MHGRQFMIHRYTCMCTTFVLFREHFPLCRLTTG